MSRLWRRARIAEVAGPRSITVLRLGEPLAQAVSFAESAREIWKSLPGEDPISEDKILDRLEQAFPDTSAADLRAALQVFLNHLESRGILMSSSGAE